MSRHKWENPVIGKLEYNHVRQVHSGTELSNAVKANNSDCPSACVCPPLDTIFFQATSNKRSINRECGSPIGGECGGDCIHLE